MIVAPIVIRDLSFLELTVDVRTTRGFKVRTAIAIWLIKLAGRIGRCSVDVRQA